jgi:DNA-binding GntR family transcriptional regulator
LRRPELPFPLIQPDPTAHLPLFRQLADSLARMILSGAFPDGCALPSSRALARQLGLSRNTVLSAYDKLAAAGLICGTAGSCTRVCAAPPLARVRNSLDLQAMLLRSQFPSQAAHFHDLEGTALYCYRPPGADVATNIS